MINADGELQIGEVIRRAFELLVDNIVTLAILAFLIVGVPSLLLSGNLFAKDVLHRGFWIGWTGNGLVLALCQALLTAAVMNTIARAEAGDAQLPVSQTIQDAVPVVLSVFFTALLYGIVVGIGFWLLVLPGVYLMVRYFVAIPVAALEKPGIMASLGRSADLTSGNRWVIFGLIVVLLILNYVLGTLVWAAFGLLGLGELAEALLTSTFAGFSAIVAVLVYRALRTAKGEAQGVISTF